MQEILKKGGIYSGTLPIATRLDISTNYYQLNSCLTIPKILINKQDELLSMCNLHDLITIKLLFAFGLRISEILNIKFEDYIGNNMFIINTLKHGSTDKILLPQFNLDDINQYKQLTGKIFYGTSYKRIYRILNSLNCYAYNQKCKTRKITHNGRLILANNVAAKVGAEKAGEVLNHKSKKTINYYVNDATRTKKK
jgi:integrase